MPGESRQGKSPLVQGGDNISPVPVNSTSLTSLFFANLLSYSMYSLRVVSTGDIKSEQRGVIKFLLWLFALI